MASIRFIRCSIHTEGSLPDGALDGNVGACRELAAADTCIEMLAVYTTANAP